MDSKKINTIEKAIELLEMEKPKFIRLVNRDGEIIQPFNSPKTQDATVKEKMKPILEALKRPSTIDGIYFLEFQNYLTKKTKTNSLTICKGNPENFLQEVKQPLRETVTVERIQAQEVWTPSQAVQHLTEKSIALYENKRLNDEIADLKSYISELETRLLQYEHQEKNESGNSSNFLKDLTAFADIISPTLEKVLSQRDKQLALTERAINLQGGTVFKKTAKSAPPEISFPDEAFREDGGIKIDSEFYLQYIAYLIQYAEEEAIDTELDLLEEINPDMYSQVCEKFNIEP